MRFSQHTVKKTYYFEGKGLHTGTYAHMKLLPAPADFGIKFRRQVAQVGGQFFRKHETSMSFCCRRSRART